MSVTSDKPEDGAATGGRSTLLRAGLRPRRRRRAWALRFGLVILALAWMAFVAVSVGGVWFPTNGPALLLYAVHDDLWLPLKGRLWIAIFPEGFVWLAIVVGLVVLVSAEFLGLVAVIRRSQISLLRWMLNGPPAKAVVGWHRVSARREGRSTLAETVLLDMRDDALLRLTRDEEVDAKGRIYARLARLQRLHLGFGLRRERDVVAVIESLALAELAPATRMDAAEGLRARAQAMTAPEGLSDWQDMLTGFRETRPVGDAIDRVTLLADPSITAMDLACETIAQALAATRDGRVQRLAWFDAWARLRVGSDSGTAERLARAEELCAYEFWAARAEAAVQRYDVAGLFAEAFPGFEPVRGRGEIFAATGEGRT